jgi:arylsulfatase A-like enzyme
LQGNRAFISGKWKIVSLQTPEKAIDLNNWMLFDLENDPNQLRNLAQDPAYASQMLDMAQKMLNWRLKHADRTLTGYAATPEGLLSRL